LVVGDIITKINGNPIKNSKEFRLFLNKVKPGDMIELEIVNSKGKRTITVIPIEKD
jgi:serine protease Do